MKKTQSANQNATNGEQDAKKIITHKELNSNQRNQIAEQFAELIVDGMDMNDLINYVHSNMMEYFCKLTVDELEEEVYNHDEELWEELVDNVTSQQTGTLNPHTWVVYCYY